MSRVQAEGLGIFEDATSGRDTRSSADSNHIVAGSEEGPASRSRASSDALGSSSHSLEMADLQSDDEAMSDYENTGLTAKSRRPHKGNGSGGRGLDDIVAASSYQQVIPGADLPVVTRLAINGLLIAAWYTFSLSISLYNKWMFGPQHLNFKLPLFTTSIHMLVQFSLASSVLYFFPKLRAGVRDLDESPPSLAEHMPSKNPESIMPLHFYLTRIGPCGLATGLDIGLGNMSLMFITLTFYTMCKSSALAFVLLFAFIFRLEQPSWRLVIIIFFMTVGVIMMVAGEASFKLIGFILIICSSFCSGFRWSLTQILLLRHPATSNPFSSIFYLAPIMFVSLFIFALAVEGSELVEQVSLLIKGNGIILSLLMIIFPGCLAFLMTSSEYALLQRTSVVTLSICGIFKEVVTVAVASTAFHDVLTVVNISGLCVTIVSIGAYNYTKVSKMRAEERTKRLGSPVGFEEVPQDER